MLDKLEADGVELRTDREDDFDKSYFHLKDNNDTK